MSGQATSATLPQASEERNASASERQTSQATSAMLPQASDKRNAAASERQASTLSSTKKPASKRGRFSFVCKLKLFSFSFSNNGESNVGLDFLIQLNNSCIFAQFLGVLHHDALAIHFETQLSQFFSNLDVAN